MESYEHDLMNKDLKEFKDGLSYERELEFFQEDTELLFNEINNNIERIRSIATGYDADMKEYIKQEIQEIFDLELKE